jgi:hypothetical protein
MQVVVTGSRDLAYSAQFWEPGDMPRSEANAARELELRLDQLDAKGDPITAVVCGGARGPDRWAMAWAKQHAVTCYVFRPDWERHPKDAGFKRNWRMLFGAEPLDEAFALRAKRVDQLERLVKIVRADAALKHHCPTLLHDLVALREPLLNAHDEARRAVMLRLGIPTPRRTRVVAFWDGRSPGTKQCMLAARILGYPVDVHRFERPEREVKNFDRAKIDHRPDPGGPAAFGSFMETGCGKF